MSTELICFKEYSNFYEDISSQYLQEREIYVPGVLYLLTAHCFFQGIPFKILDHVSIIHNTSLCT